MHALHFGLQGAADVPKDFNEVVLLLSLSL
jgi:hypothetical protein